MERTFYKHRYIVEVETQRPSNNFEDFSNIQSLKQILGPSCTSVKPFKEPSRSPWNENSDCTAAEFLDAFDMER